MPLRPPEDTTERDGRHRREIRAGIDWVTLIADSDADAAAVNRVAHELRDEHECPTAKQGTFNLMGYTGWRVGAIRLGLRGRRSMLQLSGAVADASIARLASCGGRVTRLDVQATCWLSAPQASFGRRFMRPRTPSTSSIRSSPIPSGCLKRSDGAFLGTGRLRTNSRYLRVYDKGVEARTHPPGEVWRAELEAKKELAPALYRDLLASEDPQQWCYDTLAVQWQQAGFSWPLRKCSPEARRIAADPKPETDAERSAAWLRRSVRPVVERLGASYTKTQLARMLGLLPEEESVATD